MKCTLNLRGHYKSSVVPILWLCLVSLLTLQKAHTPGEEESRLFLMFRAQESFVTFAIVLPSLLKVMLSGGLAMYASSVSIAPGGYCFSRSVTCIS